MPLTVEDLKIIEEIVEKRVAEIKVTRDEYEALRETINKLVESNRLVQEWIARLDQRITILEELVKKLDQRITMLEELVKKLDQRITMLEDRVSRLEDRVTALEELVKGLDQRITMLEERMTKLEERVKMLEERMDMLEERMKMLEERMDKLEERMTMLEERMDKLEERVARVEDALISLEKAQKALILKIGALGARWGIDSESAFREALKGILADAGFQVESFLKFDSEGIVFGQPDQVEIDVIIKDKIVMVAEIKSSVNKSDIATLNKKVIFYEKTTGRKVGKKIVISPFVDPRGTKELAQKLNILIYTSPEELTPEAT